MAVLLYALKTEETEAQRVSILVEQSTEGKELRNPPFFHHPSTSLMVTKMVGIQV
jgi:hypothetical protein